MDENVDYKSMSDEQLLALEQEYERQAARYGTEQLALKILINSLYGALGQKDFRYFDIALASSVTLSGQLSIKWIERKVNEFISAITKQEKDRVVLIDTDSIVLNLQDLVQQKCPNIERSKQLDFLNVFGERAMNPFIDKSYQELAEYMNAYQQKMHMKRENIFNVLVSCAPKMYAGSVYNSEGVQYSLDNPKWKIMGLALVKSSTPKVVRDSLKSTLEIILRNGTESDVQEYVKSVKEEYYKNSIEDIAFPRGITELGKYDRQVVEKMLQTASKEELPILKKKLEAKSDCYVLGTPIHVKAALLYNKLIDDLSLGQKYTKIKDRERVKFVYLKTPNPIGEEVIGFQEKLPPEFGISNYVDWDKMFDKSYTTAMTTITDILGWELTKANNLSDFFS